MDINHDYNAAFKSISVKLKKRFYRKPNVSDAIEEYTTLSRQLENEECYGLSAYCMQQVAKSYHSVGNTISESAALQQAAKLYLNSQIASTVESGIVTFNEDLLNVISLYEETIRLHCDQNERQLAAKLSLELADLLAVKFERYFESIAYYEKAIGLFSPKTPLEQSNLIPVLLVQSKLAVLKVFTCDYAGALTLYTDIVNSITVKCQAPKSTAPAQPRTASISSSATAATSKSLANEMSSLSLGNKSAAAAAAVAQQLQKPTGIFSSLLIQSEISKLLLLLYLKPTKLKSEHSTTLDVFSWFQSLTDNTANTYLPLMCMDKDLFILLQSFVMSCQSDDNDLKLIYTLQAELWPHLNDVQNHVLNLIIDQLLNSSYTDDLLTEEIN